MAVEVSGIQPLGVETVKENTGKPLKLWARVGWDGAFVVCAGDRIQWCVYVVCAGDRIRWCVYVVCAGDRIRWCVYLMV